MITSPACRWLPRCDPAYKTSNGAPRPPTPEKFPAVACGNDLRIRTQNLCVLVSTSGDLILAIYRGIIHCSFFILPGYLIWISRLVDILLNNRKSKNERKTILQFPMRGNLHLFRILNSKPQVLRFSVKFWKTVL